MKCGLKLFQWCYHVNSNLFLNYLTAACGKREKVLRCCGLCATVCADCAVTVVKSRVGEGLKCELSSARSAGQKSLHQHLLHLTHFFSIGETFHRYDRTSDRTGDALSGPDISVNDNRSDTSKQWAICQFFIRGMEPVCFICLWLASTHSWMSLFPPIAL